MRGHRIVRLVALAALGLAAGVLAGAWLRRARERPTLPPRRHRVPAVAAALDAWSRGRPEEVARYLKALGPGEPADPEDRADAAFLRAFLSGDPVAMDAVVDRYPVSEAAGRAAWWGVEHASDEAERERRLASFRARWPDAWVLPEPAAGPGPR